MRFLKKLKTCEESGEVHAVWPLLMCTKLRRSELYLDTHCDYSLE